MTGQFWVAQSFFHIKSWFYILWLISQNKVLFSVCCDIQDYLKYRCHLSDMENNMRKYIPLVLFIFSWPVLCADIHGRVFRVLDGDTIEVMDSRKAVRIRLINIDAPEKKQDYGRWSTDMMKSLVAWKTVTVTYFQRDRYGRILGQVYAPDGMNVNQFMVRAGAAWVYEQYNTDPVLPVLQNEARQQKRGLWSDADPVPPWIWRHRK